MRGSEDAKVGFKVLLDCKVEVTKWHCRLILSWCFLSIGQDYLPAEYICAGIIRGEVEIRNQG